MRLLIAIASFVMSVSPALSLDLMDKPYIGLDKSTIKSTYSCTPSFLIMGGSSRLVCNDNDIGILVFILKENKVVSVDITHSNPPLTFNEATSLLQSQCVAEEDNATFKCKNGIQAAVSDQGFAVVINLCLQGDC